MTDTETNIQPEDTGQIEQIQPERIKLKKNSKGVYEWEIKTLPINDKHILTSDIERLDAINKELEERFGGLRR
jgi:hypothetical protein